MRINGDKAICVAIDYQEKLMPSIYERESLIRNSEKFLRGMEILGVPLIATEQYPKGLGETIPEIKGLAKEWKSFAKTTFSAYEDPEFRKAIQGNQFVLLCGIETHICVLQTAMDLKAAGYRPVIVADCVSSRTIQDRQFGLARAGQEGILLTTSEALIFELTQGSQNPAFKTVSALIKEFDRK